MSASADLDLVAAFHGAVNAADATRLLTLVTPDVEVGGPRGSGSGAAMVADWLARAGISLTPKRVFARDATLVVEQDATWKDGAGGAPGPAQTVASVLRLRDGRIAAILRYGDLTEALAAAGLSPDDLVPGTAGA
jgi:ketosteroid isomerase-like protein